MTTPKPTSQLHPKDQWIADVDLDGFKAEIQQLGKELAAGQGEQDVAHLNKMLLWIRVLTIVGIATLWVYPNPLTVVCLSLGTFARWTMVGHHVCHGGYDKCDKTGRYNRFKFAVGSLYQRVVDWFDWMLPEAWNVEHNQLHHYHLSESKDPDLVEENLEYLREMQVPLFLKYAIVIFFMGTWKWFYYAPNTYNHLKIAQLRKQGVKTDKLPRFHLTFLTIFEAPEWISLTELFFRVLLPYAIYRFVLIPLPFYFLVGPQAFNYALVNLLLADILTNVHGFIAVVPNHAGDDMYRFQKHCKPRGPHFYLRQVISSVDFSTGTDLVDFMHGFLNYQIEHHLWPDLSMLSYQRSQPKVKAICAKYGIPYVQESVWWRLKKTLDIMVGNADMRPFPVEYEPTDYDNVSSDLAAEESNKVAQLSGAESAKQE